MTPLQWFVFLASLLFATLIAYVVVYYMAPPESVVIVYGQEKLPAWWRAGPRLFLAGPTWGPLPLEGTHGGGGTIERRTGWRVALIAMLRQAGYKGYVYVPEFEDGSFKRWKDAWSAAHPKENASEQIVRWEHEALENAHVRLFWMPFEMPLPDNPSDTQLGKTTRCEIGWWLARDPGSVVAAFPKGASGSAFVRFHAKAGHAQLMLDTDMSMVVNAIMRKVGLWPRSR